jgi:hypothetical protein
MSGISWKLYASAIVGLVVATVITLLVVGLYLVLHGSLAWGILVLMADLTAIFGYLFYTYIS